MVAESPGAAHGVKLGMMRSLRMPKVALKKPGGSGWPSSAARRSHADSWAAWESTTTPSQSKRTPRGGLGDMSGEVELMEDVEVIDHEVRFGGGDDFREFVAGEDGDRADAAGFGGVDIVAHVADHDGVVGGEIVLGEEGGDAFAFIEDTGVDAFEEVVESEMGGLAFDGVLGCAGEDEEAEIASGAGFEVFAGVGDDGDGLAGGAEGAVPDGVEFFEGDAGEVFFVIA